MNHPLYSVEAFGTVGVVLWIGIYAVARVPTGALVRKTPRPGLSPKHAALMATVITVMSIVAGVALIHFQGR